MPEPVSVIKRSVTQEIPAHQDHGAVNDQGGISTAHQTPAVPISHPQSQQEGEWHFQAQGEYLDPGDRLGSAQALIERAEEPKQQGRRQRPGQHLQVFAHGGLHGVGHFGPRQQGVGPQQGQHAHHRVEAPKIQRLAELTTHFVGAVCAMQFGQHGQQGLL